MRTKGLGGTPASQLMRQMRNLLLLFLIFFGFVWAVRQFLRPRKHVGPPSRGGSVPREEGEEMVKDPVCGVYVPRSAAVTKGTSGGLRYFCSEKCRDEFDGQ